MMQWFLCGLATNFKWNTFAFVQYFLVHCISMVVSQIPRDEDTDKCMYIMWMYDISNELFVMTSVY